MCHKLRQRRLFGDAPLNAAPFRMASNRGDDQRLRVPVVPSSNLYKPIGQRNDGLGWGGPYGWNGWWGGHRIRLHGSHGTGVWHHRPAAHAFAGVAPASPVLAGGVAPARPGVVGSGVPVFHGFAGGGQSPSFWRRRISFPWLWRRRASIDRFRGQRRDSVRGFVGGAPGLQDLAAAPQLSMGLGGGGGFHGGGAFSFGGHGGGGHR